MALTVGVSLTSCVDNQYDLSDVDTDDIPLGNEMTLPLGKGIISADELIDVKVNPEIEVDSRGDYVIRYEGVFSINTPLNLRFDDFSLPQTMISMPFLTPGVSTYPDAIDLPLSNQECDLHFVTTGISRLDSVWFSNENRASLLRFTLSLNEVTFRNGNSTVEFNAMFPKGFKIQPQTPQDGVVNGNQFTRTIPVQELTGKGKTITLLLQRAVVGGNDQIQYHTVLHVGAGSTIETLSAPSLDVHGGVLSPKFEVVYGLFENEFSTDPIEIRTEGLDNLFDGGDNLLSFADPRLLLTASSNVGIPLNTSLAITASNATTGQSVSVDANNLMIKAPATYGETAISNVWLGTTAASVLPQYTYTACAIPDLLKITPGIIAIGTAIRTDAGSTSGASCFFPQDAAIEVNYAMEVPLAPAADFRVNTNQMIDDVFDEDLIQYLFSSGSVEIYGSVTNTLPLNLKMNLVITNANQAPVGIQCTPQTVKGSPDGKGVSSNVSFLITADDMPKMEQARNIRLQLDASCDKTLEGKNLRPEQTLELVLKIKKTGGIIL